MDEDFAICAPAFSFHLNCASGRATVRICARRGNSSRSAVRDLPICYAKRRQEPGHVSGVAFRERVHEYGFIDCFQASISLDQHYFYNHEVTGDRDALVDRNYFRFGGVAASGKYRVLSPFKDPVGIALRLEAGYLLRDEVDGLKQHERYVKPEIDFQKDFFDDTLTCVFDLGVEWAWGKQPAEQYPKEVSFEGAAGVAYRFAPNWFAGAEIHTRWEYPQFDLYNFEHRVFYVGPSIHYSQQRWWATLSWNYQVYGKGVDEPDDGQTFAEETRQVVRLKIGINF